MTSIPHRSDFDEPWFAYYMNLLEEPWQVHRKLWEFVVIARAYDQHIKNGGGSALGFGVGQEPLAAFFARRGAKVLATDAAHDTGGWSATAQRAEGIDSVLSRVTSETERLALQDRMAFCYVDMNYIPSGLLKGQFDFTWSAGSMEHIGSIDATIDFMCNQMQCLKRGGIAVHTTEFCRERSYESPNLCLLSEDDLREIERRLTAAGHKLQPLDLTPGSHPDDRYISKPPDYKLPHLLAQVGSAVTTSVVLVAQRG